MKKVQLLLILFTSLLFLNFNKPINNVSITFKIKNPKNKFVVLRDNYWKPIDTIQLSKKKNNVNLNEGYYFFSYGDNSAHVYLKPQDNLDISFDAENFQTSLSYFGKGEKENNYLADKDRLTNSIPHQKRFYSYYAFLNEVAFLKQTDSIYQAFLKLFKQKNNSLNKEFNYLEINAIKIENAIRLAQFQNQKRFVTNNQKYVVSKEYPNPFKNVPLNKPELLNTYWYRDLVHDYFNTKAMLKTNDNKSGDFFIQYLLDLSSSKFNPKIIDELGLYIADNGFTYSKKPLLFYQAFLKFATIEKHKIAFKKLFHKKNNEKGKPSPDFKFVGFDKNTYSLKDFKGKYIYIDIWASWCSPCIKEIPHLQKLEKEFSEKINFVSIAWNDSSKNWNNFIKSKNLKGFQLFGEKGSAFFKFFNIEGIPRFILLDKEGKIIESKAKRPSFPLLKKQLEDLK
jgi:thiol-disulfide isomerase/thioredoxin